MEPKSMALKILLPHRVFIIKQEVISMVVETFQGAYGLLPNRLDGVAALVPGILTYETPSEGKKYIAIDEGILVKAGQEVTVSVRNAIAGLDLGLLHEAADKQFIDLDQKEKSLRTTLAKMENGFLQQLRKLKHD